MTRKKKHINNFLAPTQSRDTPANLFMFMCFFFLDPGPLQFLGAPWPYHPYGWDSSEELRSPERFRKDPGNFLRVFLEFPREHGWEPKSPLIQGIFQPPEHFQPFEGPLRAGHGIRSSTEGISDPKNNRAYQPSAPEKTWQR